MKKITCTGLTLLLLFSLVLSACWNKGTTDNAQDSGTADTPSQQGGPPPGGAPGGGPGGEAVDTSSRVTDVAAVMKTDSGAAASTCTSGDAPAQVVCLAQAFAKTLTEQELTSLKYEMTSQNAAVWSNLPAGSVKRNGLMLASLNTNSLEAFKGLAAAALGGSGYATLKSIMMADEFLTTDTGNQMWDADLYYIAFLGEPSTSAPWILQIGGHHYAVNLTYNTKLPSSTPMFVGVEPQTFTINGTAYAPLVPRHDAMYSMLGSLSESELASAKLTKSFDDVLVGPGQDAKFPASEGLLVSSLNSDQKAKVKTAIEAWVKDTSPAISQELLAAYLSDEELGQTRVAWSGSTDSKVHGSYIRIDGPRVWIEFVCQTGVAYKDQIHFHTIWRDKTADYGGSFSA